jgi:hypothetical protein
MIHEPRCIHIPCTCIEILRSKIVDMKLNIDIDRRARIKELKDRVYDLESVIKGMQETTDKNYEYTMWKELNQVREITKLKAHIENMSCCCSGCTKHNQNLSAPIDK